MKLLSQRDPAWANVKIGSSNLTLGIDGCVITDLSMLTDWYNRYLKAGVFRNPEWIAKNLDFTPSGLIYWKSVKKLGFNFDWRFYRYDEGRILPALSGKLTACLLRLYEGTKTHWVVGIRKVGSYYYVANPYPLPSGRREFIHKSIISGGATFTL